MKTLRSFRNIAALFILGMALLSLHSGVGVAHAGGKSCSPVGSKKGFFCTIDASGKCVEFHCKGIGCNNSGCL